MKKLLLLLTLLITGMAFGQNVRSLRPDQMHGLKNDNLIDRVKLEAGWGLNVPLTPSKGTNSVENFYLGANYKINELWGVRGTYSYNGFDGNSISDSISNGEIIPPQKIEALSAISNDSISTNSGLTVHRLMVEVTLSLTNVFTNRNIYNRSPFNIIAHAGFGASLGKAKDSNGKDLMLNFQVGIMPTYKISDRIDLLVDLTYVGSISQNTSYAGEPIEDTTGGYLLANIGVSFKLGK